jgi:hypothetical protein
MDVGGEEGLSAFELQGIHGCSCFLRYIRGGLAPSFVCCRRYVAVSFLVLGCYRIGFSCL